MIYMFGPSKFSTFRIRLCFLHYAVFTTWNSISYEVSPQDLQIKLIGHIIIID
jgi:hypothetical protein